MAAASQAQFLARFLPTPVTNQTTRQGHMFDSKRLLVEVVMFGEKLPVGAERPFQHPDAVRSPETFVRLRHSSVVVAPLPDRLAIEVGRRAGSGQARKTFVVLVNGDVLAEAQRVSGLFPPRH